jgi:uncharacterized membrane protein
MNPDFGTGPMMYGQRMMERSDVFGGFWIFAIAGVLLITAIAIAVIVWAIARSHKTPGGAHSPGSYAAPPAADSALAIARERLARGEIDPEQYATIVAALRT